MQDTEEAERGKEKNRIGNYEGKDMLQLLRNCSGAFRPGILTALVGSSGAGKVLLLYSQTRARALPPPLPHDLGLLASCHHVQLLLYHLAVMSCGQCTVLFARFSRSLQYCQYCTDTSGLWIMTTVRRVLTGRVH